MNCCNHSSASRSRAEGIGIRLTPHATSSAVNVDIADTEVSVYDGLAHIGEALHHRQDSFAHNASHNAETPFDHAPSFICLLWGDGFGIIYRPCIDARQNNPNWSNPHRPDDPGQWPADHAATLADAKRLLEQIWNIPAVRCYCCGK